MTTLLQFLKKIPWWVWIAAVVLIFLLYQSMTGWAMSRKLYTMMLDELRADQSRIIEQKDEWIKTCEDEINRLQAEQERLRKEKAAIQQQAAQSASEVARLKGEVNALRVQLQSVVVPDDPDRVIDGLRKHFPSIRKF